MSRNNGYRPGLRWLHAIIAALVVPQWWLGWIGERTAEHEAAMEWLQIHFQLGVLIAILMVWRLGLRLRGPAPDPEPDPVWKQRIASAVHFLLYLLLFLLPASGYVIWVWMDAPRTMGPLELPAMFTPPADDETGRAVAWYVHIGAAWLLAAAVSLHVGAALWHGLIRRDGRVTRRMGLMPVRVGTRTEERPSP